MQPDLNKWLNIACEKKYYRIVSWPGEEFRHVFFCQQQDLRPTAAVQNPDYKAEGGWENTTMKAMHNSTQNEPDKDKILFLVHRGDMKSAPKDKLKKAP